MNKLTENGLLSMIEDQDTTREYVLQILSIDDETDDGRGSTSYRVLISDGIIKSTSLFTGPAATLVVNSKILLIPLKDRRNIEKKYHFC